MTTSPDDNPYAFAEVNDDRPESPLVLVRQASKKSATRSAVCFAAVEFDRLVIREQPLEPTDAEWPAHYFSAGEARDRLTFHEQGFDIAGTDGTNEQWRFPFDVGPADWDRLLRLRQWVEGLSDGEVARLKTGFAYKTMWGIALTQLVIAVLTLLPFALTHDAVNDRTTAAAISLASTLAMALQYAAVIFWRDARGALAAFGMNLFLLFLLLCMIHLLPFSRFTGVDWPCYRSNDAPFFPPLLLTAPICLPFYLWIARRMIAFRIIPKNHSP